MSKPLFHFLIPLLAVAGLAACSPKEARQIADLQKSYPPANCPVSGAKLGEMGKPTDYLYRNSGAKPELVRFCCPGCIAKFDAAPDKYLQIIHAAK
jgi:hypothetical protein